MTDFMSFATVLVFLVVGCLFISLVLFLSRLFHRLLHDKKPSQEKLITYECGEDPVGDTRIRFNVRFYIIALIFLIFDVEIVLMFPWGVVFRSFDPRGVAFLEMLFFAGILLVGLAYVWGKGDLEWIKTARSREDFDESLVQVGLETTSNVESD